MITFPPEPQTLRRLKIELVCDLVCEIVQRFFLLQDERSSGHREQLVHSETVLPDRPISPHPNLVTAAGLTALQSQLDTAREAYEAAQKIEDVNERRRQAAIPLRDLRYLAERVRTAQVVANPVSAASIAFGSTVTFRRDDGRVQTYRIVGEDEADPKAESISYVSPIARLLLGKAVGDEVGPPGQSLEVIAIA